MSLVILGSQAPMNHALCCPLVAWSFVVIGVKVSTSIGAHGSWVSLISSSSPDLAHLSATGKWFLEYPGSKGQWHQSTDWSREARSTRDRRNQASLRPSRRQRLDSLVTQHQAGNDALVPRFLGPTFPREQGTMAAGRPR